MNPCRFGRSDRPLFGVYDAPRLSVARDAAVLICAPIAQEYMRTHWAIRQLAAQLAYAGFHVLRFDYSGVGDSALQDGRGRVPMWIEDIQSAEKEIREISGAKRLVVVGLRLGATLAAEALKEGAVQADQLILWDPVVSGKTYLQQLQRMTTEIAHERAKPPGASDFLLGFCFPQVLRQEIESLDLVQAASQIPTESKSILASEELDEYRQLADSLKNLNFQYVTEPGSWDLLAQAHHALLPSQMIKAIVQKAEAQI